MNSFFLLTVRYLLCTSLIPVSAVVSRLTFIMKTSADVSKQIKAQSALCTSCYLWCFYYTAIRYELQLPNDSLNVPEFIEFSDPAVRQTVPDQ